jgi:hypothetical protein
MFMVRYSSGEQEMDKDTLTRNLKLVWRIVVGISVLLPPEQVPYVLRTHKWRKFFCLLLFEGTFT